MKKSDHEKLMELLDSVPGVKEHMNSFEVVMGKELIKKRIEKGLTIEELASITGVDKKTIKDYESGTVSIKFETLDKLKKVLGIN